MGVVVGNGRELADVFEKNEKKTKTASVDRLGSVWNGKLIF